MKIKSKIILLIIFVGIIASVGQVSAFFGLFEGPNPDELVTIEGNENNTWDLVPEGTPLYDEGYSATIDINGSNGNGTETYYISDYAYLKLLSYLYVNGTYNSFKAEVVQKKVLLNENASVIENVYDMNNQELTQ